MKLNRRILVVMTVVAGSLAMMGCNRASDVGNEPIAPEQTAAEAPVENGDALPGSASAGVERDERRAHYYAPHAPPAARHEWRGRAPSERHFWAPGYHRWNGREHV